MDIGRIGFSNALQILAQFWLFNCDKDLMEAWLVEKLGASFHKSAAATLTRALQEWTDNHL